MARSQTEIEFTADHPVVLRAQKKLNEHFERQILGMTIDELITLRYEIREKIPAMAPARTSFSILDWM